MHKMHDNVVRLHQVIRPSCYTQLKFMALSKIQMMKTKSLASFIYRSLENFRLELFCC